MKEKRIGPAGTFGLLTFALLCDLLQFIFTLFHVIPVAGTAVAVVFTWFITFIAFALLGILFMALWHVQYFSGKRAALRALAALGPVAVEMLPLFNALPAVTAGVALMIATNWMNTSEDKEAGTAKALGLMRQAAQGPAGMLGAAQRSLSRSTKGAIPERATTPRERELLSGTREDVSPQEKEGEEA